MDMSPLWTIYNHCSRGLLSTDVAKWPTRSCSRPQPAKDNGVRDGWSNWLAVTPHPLQECTPWAPPAHANARYKSEIKSVDRGCELGTFGTLGHRIGYAAT